MQYIAIPAKVINSEAYRKLSMPQRAFLIDLYALFIDCERFTIDVDRPQDYRQMPGAGLAKKITSLLEAGFIEVCGRQKTTPHHSRRVFKFCFPAIDLDEDKIIDDELNDTLISLNSNYELRA